MKRIILFFAILISVNTISFGQGKLEKAEESLKEKEKRSNSRRSRSNNSNNVSNSDGNFLTELIGGILVEAFLYSTYYTLIRKPF